MGNKFCAIKAAVERRNKFLKEHPQMQVFQDEIDKELAKAGNQHNRMAVLENLLYIKRNELLKALEDLSGTLKKLTRN